MTSSTDDVIERNILVNLCISKLDSISTCKQGCGSWKRSYFNGSRSAKNVPLPLPHHLKKHTVNNLLDIIFYSIY